MTTQSITPSDGHSSLQLALVVAASTQGGIGRDNDLPWPALKKDLAFFARLTKEVTGLGGDAVPSLSKENATSTQSTTTATNIVIMGRRTWDSIPLKWRPLSGRINIILSRNTDFVHSIQVQSDPRVHAFISLQVALDAIQSTSAPYSWRGESPNRRVVFIVGGSSVYQEAMNHPCSSHLFLTRVQRVDGANIPCDTHFPTIPVDLGWRRAPFHLLQASVTLPPLAIQTNETGTNKQQCLVLEETVFDVKETYQLTFELYTRAIDAKRPLAAMYIN